MAAKLSEGLYLVEKKNTVFIEEKKAEFNKKREKLISKGRLPEDFPELTLDYEDFVYEDFMKKSSDEYNYINSVHDLKNNHNDYIMVRLNINKTLTLGSWSVLGVLESSETGNSHTVSSFNKDNPVPEKYRHEDPCNCDHCGFSRKRKSTFILRSNKTDEEIQVGKSCMKDFVGDHKSLEFLIYLNSINDFMVDTDFDLIRGGSDYNHYHKKDFLVMVGRIIDQTNGYVSLKNADINNAKPQTTLAVKHAFSDYALNSYINIFKHAVERDPQVKEFVKEYLKIINIAKNKETTDKEIEFVDNLIKHFKENPPTKKDSEFYFNMHSIITNDSTFVSKNEPNLVAYSVQYFNNIQKKEHERKIKEAIKDKSISVSPYIGVEKDKLEDIEVRIKKIEFSDDDYGGAYKYLFETRDGRELSWRGSNCAWLTCLDKAYEDNTFSQMPDVTRMIKSLEDEGKSLWTVIKGTVKYNMDFKIPDSDKTVKRTVLNRVSSIDEYYTEPKNDVFLRKKEKYISGQFFVDNVEKGKSYPFNEDLFKYTLKNKDDFAFHIISSVKIEQFEKGNFVTMPYQRTSNEIQGLMPNNIKIVDNFDPEFVEEEMTANKAYKYNIDKKVASNKKVKPK